MSVVTINGQKVNIEHLPITRRNEDALREMYERTQEFLSEHGVNEWQSRVAKAVAKTPDLLDYIRPDGGYNETELLRIAARIREYDAHEHREDDNYIPMTTEASLKKAAEKLVQDYQAYLSSVPDIARILYFSPDDWPVTRAGLNKGIEIIIGTVDTAKLPEDLRSMWNTVTPSSDVWLDTEASEVAAYVNGFRTAYGADPVSVVADRPVGSVEGGEARPVGVPADGPTVGVVDAEELPAPAPAPSQGASRGTGDEPEVEHVGSGDTANAT